MKKLHFNNWISSILIYEDVTHQVVFVKYNKGGICEIESNKS